MLDLDIGNFGLFGLFHLIAIIYAIVNVASSAVSVGKKVVWILLLLFLPILGLIIWFLVGPRSR